MSWNEIGSTWNQEIERDYKGQIQSLRVDILKAYAPFNQLTKHNTSSTICENIYVAVSKIALQVLHLGLFMTRGDLDYVTKSTESTFTVLTIQLSVYHISFESFAFINHQIDKLF